MSISRTQFLKKMLALSIGSFMLPKAAHSSKLPMGDSDIFFKISLAEWSFNKALNSGDMTHMQFPEIAKNEFDIRAVEYVSQFFDDKVEDKSYLKELNQRCNDLGVQQLLIMVDGEGDLAVLDKKIRQQAIVNHYKWIEAANFLGCHSIRVNLFGNGTKSEQKIASIESLGKLSEFASDYEINVVVENHGGFSSDGQWLADVISQVGMKNCGTLPDFGNFCLRREGGARWGAPCIEEYNRYEGIQQLMPFAKGVSAKSYAFDQEGQETTIDYYKMLKIVHDAGYDGYIGIEYEGNDMNAYDGIRHTKRLLLKAGKMVSNSN